MTSTEHEQRRLILTLSCPEKKGIVKAVSGFLYDVNATITEAAQHRDAVSDQFFLRMEFAAADLQDLPAVDNLRQVFAAVATEFSMKWRIREAQKATKVVVAVSKFGHCLNDVLHRWKAGILPIDITAVVSNHEDMRELVEWHGLPYHFLPVTKATKPEQEQHLLAIINGQNAELLLLARYMQILSNDFCDQLAGKAINIHHSFLPSFKGAQPYNQAYERGVKIIGATAHYVTSDLDEGPIIEQCVERVDHRHTHDELVQIGRDAECMAFARAIKWHCEHRVILNGRRTIVLK